MITLEMEKAAICSSMRQELERWTRMLEKGATLAALRYSAVKIQGYCARLKEIEEQESRAA